MGKWTVAGWIGLAMVFLVFSFLVFGGWWVLLAGWCGGGGGEGMVWYGCVEEEEEEEGTKNKKESSRPAPGTLCSILIPSQRYFDELMTGSEGEHAVQSCLLCSLTFITTPSNQIIICFTSELWCSVSACPWSHRSIIRI